MMKEATKGRRDQGTKGSAWRFASALSLACVVASPAHADRDFASDVPPELEGVGVVENLGGMIPLDVEWRDHTGKKVTFRDLLADGKPAIITPVFYNCPMLCTQVLNGLTDGMAKLEWSIGKEFNVITYSFHPEETPELAAPKRKAYLDFYERPGGKDGWQFLVGSQESITAMNGALGIKTKLGDDGLYAHTATIVFVAADGRITRYMNDVMFAERDLRFALIEASQGQIGSPMDQFLLMMCYQYDPDKNSFAPSAWKIMRGGGALTLIVLAVTLSALWLRDIKRRHAAAIVEDGDSTARRAVSDPSGAESRRTDGAPHAG